MTHRIGCPLQFFSLPTICTTIITEPEEKSRWVFADHSLPALAWLSTFWLTYLLLGDFPLFLKNHANCLKYYTVFLLDMHVCLTDFQVLQHVFIPIYFIVMKPAIMCIFFLNQNSLAENEQETNKLSCLSCFSFGLRFRCAFLTVQSNKLPRLSRFFFFSFHNMILQMWSFKFRVLTRFCIIGLLLCRHGKAVTNSSMFIMTKEEY